tara:strand:+ start:390 stop:980 length:591 start_codon:yes stop_codon:yes gene_type:complete
MSLASRAGDLYYSFRFVKLLTTPWEETDAYKLGIIDKDGKRIKSKKIDSSEEKDSYTTFNRLVFNIKRLLSKAPGGKSTMASYAASLFLLREKFNLSNKTMENLVEKCNIEVMDLVTEGTSNWFLLEDKCLSQGTYTILSEKLLSKTLSDMVYAGDKIRVSESNYPVGEIFGLDVYEGVHINTGQSVYFCIGEIKK